jgi:hypothetical protein
MKTLLPLLFFVLVSTNIIKAQTARVQIIHNSADIAANTVDIYLGTTLLVDDFEFRTATPYIDAPAGSQIVIGVAPGNSSSSGDAIATFPITLTANETYVVVAEGIVSTSGYSPATSFGLSIYNMGREVANNATEIDLLVHHGSTDAPTVDVQTQDLQTTLVDNAAYGDFAGYLSLADQDYTISVTDSIGTGVVASYQAPLNTLSLAGNAITVVASGFLDPSVNSNGPAFGLWVALASGGALVELPSVGTTARLQVIHNSADAAATTVDVYLDSALLLDDFAFRTATAFIDAPAGYEVSISVAPSTSTSVGDAIATFPITLTPSETYIVIAEGIVSATGYTPATPFGLSIYGMGQEAAINTNEVDLLIHHGSTDAPIVDVKTFDQVTTLVDNAAYGDFAGYIALGNQDYNISVMDSSASTVVASYTAPLNTLGLVGNAITVVASGFLDPSVNSNGPAFGLWVALASGGAMVELPAYSSSILNIRGAAEQITVYPNPVTDVLNMNLDSEMNSSAMLTITDMQGRVVRTENIQLVAGSNKISTNTNLLSSGMYIINIQTNNKFYASTFMNK